MSVIWEDPPEKQRGNGGKGRAGVDWLAVVEELRSRPGEWGRVATCPRAGTKAAALARLIRGGLAPFTVGEFEATSRQVGDEGRVYARYVSPGSTSPEPGPADCPPGCGIHSTCTQDGPTEPDEQCCPAYPNCHEPVPGPLVDLPPLPPKWQGEEYLSRHPEHAAEPTKGGTDG